MKAIIEFIANLGNHLIDWFVDYRRNRAYQKFVKNSGTRDPLKLERLRAEWLRYQRKARNKK